MVFSELLDGVLVAIVWKRPPATALRGVLPGTKVVINLKQSDKTKKADAMDSSPQLARRRRVGKKVTDLKCKTFEFMKQKRKLCI